MNRKSCSYLLILLAVIIWVACITYLNMEKQESVIFYLTSKFVRGCSFRLQALEDILSSAEKPTINGSIFFHEARLPSVEPNIRHVIELKAREACSIESAALHNPNSSVFVLFLGAAYYYPRKTPLINALLTYSNVHLRAVNLWTYTDETPIYDWVLNGTLFKGRYVAYDIVDSLPYVTLWRFGGTYLDLDSIVLRSLDDLPANYVGVESHKYLGAGVLNFAATGIGHEVAQHCLKNFANTYGESDYGNNGVITRVIQNLCAEKNIDKIAQQSECRGFHIYQQSAFYPIQWKDCIRLFLTDRKQNMLRYLNNSYVVHMWNKLCGDMRSIVELGSPLLKIAEENCPKTFAIAKHEF